MTRVPGYWKNETSGVLRPAVEAYLKGGPMTGDQIAAMRAYLRQWIAGDFRGPVADVLRSSVGGLNTRERLRRWIDAADDEGMDPL